MALTPLQDATWRYTRLRFWYCAVKRGFATTGDMRAGKKMMPISVRLDEDVREGLDKLAAEYDRSVSYLLNVAARRYVEAETSKKSGRK